MVHVLSAEDEKLLSELKDDEPLTEEEKKLLAELEDDEPLTEEEKKLLAELEELMRNDKKTLN